MLSKLKEFFKSFFKKEVQKKMNIYNINTSNDSLIFNDVKVRLLDCTTDKEIERYNIVSRQYFDGILNEDILNIPFELPLDSFTLKNVKFEITINCQKFFTDCQEIDNSLTIIDDLCLGVTANWVSTGNVYCEKVNDINTGFQITEQQDLNKECTKNENRLLRVANSTVCKSCSNISWNNNTKVCNDNETQVTLNTNLTDVEYSLNNSIWTTNNVFSISQTTTFYVRQINCTEVITTTIGILDCNEVTLCADLNISVSSVTTDSVTFNVTGTNVSSYIVSLKQGNIVLSQTPYSSLGSKTIINLSAGSYSIEVSSENCSNTDQDTFVIQSSILSCDNGNSAFAILGVNVIDSSNLLVDFNAANFSTGNYLIVQNGNTIQSSSLITSSNPVMVKPMPISLSSSLSAGTYSLILNGDSCQGSASLDFVIEQELPSCDNDNTAFEIITAEYLNAGIDIYFNANNFSELTYKVTNILTNQVVNTGTYSNISSNTITLNTGVIVDGSYELEISGVTCNGTATKLFEVQECVNNAECTTVADKPAGAASLRGFTSNASPSNSNPISFEGWVIDDNNLTTPQSVDVYISDKYVGTVTANAQNATTANALNVSTSTLLIWTFQLTAVKWWQDGTSRKLEAFHAGTSKRLPFYQGQGVPAVDSINISFAGGGSGICVPPFKSVDLPTLTPTVQLNASAFNLGRSATPLTDSFDYLSTNEIVVGLNNHFGSMPDYISKVGNGRSISNQYDSGRQFGIDSSMGAEDSDYYINTLGWETVPYYQQGAYEAGFNCIPQGVYDQVIAEPNNFAGTALSKQVVGNIHKSTAKTYQFPWAKRNSLGNLEKIDSHITHEQEVSFVKQNVAKFKVKLTVENTLPLDYGALFVAADGFITDFRSSPYLFYDRSSFNLMKLYEGSSPFTGDTLTTFDINTMTVDREQRNWNSSEGWISACNPTDTDGIGLVWHLEDNQNKAVGIIQTGTTTNPTDSGSGIFYNSRTHSIFKGQSIEMTYYIVVGNSTTVRNFAKALHGLDCTS